MAKILIGTDPEVFLRHKFTKRFVSAAEGNFPGSKEEPFPLDRGAMQVDGHALEFNTDPVSTEDEFVEVVNHVFSQVKGYVEATDPNLEIVLEPVAHFDEDYFEHLPEPSKVLGCTPDFSAITGKQLDAPNISHVPMRTSSGHIHIGWTKDEDAFDAKEFQKRFVLANRITPYLLKVAEGWETPASRERRNYYGRDGAFRPKSYGVELRALDCLWLADESRMRQVFRAAVEGFTKEAQYAL
jgi:hypothetical protein